MVARNSLSYGHLCLIRWVLCRRSWQILGALFVVLAGTSSGEAVERNQTWPEFRGPRGDGQAVVADLPDVIDIERHVRWRTPIHGKGWSSPVVWGDQVWLTTATEDGKNMSVLCVGTYDGKIQFDIPLISNKEPAFCHPMNSYATPTPVLEQGRVYVHFGSYGTACLDSASGKTIWERRDLPCDHFRGPASSPILYGDLLIVALDGFDLQYVVALDKQTGKTVWRQDRQIEYGTDDGDLKKAYCTGTIIQVDGHDQLVYPSAVGTEAYDPLTGKRIWLVYHQGMNASARPLFGQGLVFITNGMGNMVAVRPNGSGDVTESHVAWSSTRAIARQSSQLLIDDLLYMFADNGVATCRHAVSGEIVWQERLEGEFSASPVLAGGLIYVGNTAGKFYTIRPGKKLDVVSTADFDSGFMASPAVVGQRLILRTKTDLVCVAK